MTNPVRALPMRVASYRLRADSFRKGSGGSSSLLHPRVLQKRVQGPLARIIAFRTPPLIHPSLPKQPSRDVHVPTDGYHLPGCTWGNGPAGPRKVARITHNIKHDRRGERQMPVPDDSTAEEKHSNHNRTNIAPRQAPAWAPFTFQGLSRELRHAAHGRFVEARPARPTSTRLRSRHARDAPAGGSIVAQTKRDTVPRGVPARCRTGRLEEPWHAQPNAPRPRTTRAATNG